MISMSARVKKYHIHQMLLVSQVSGKKVIPMYAYWGALLEPWAKKQTLALLDADEKRQIWSDIQDELVTIAVHQSEAELNNNNNNNNHQQQRRLKGAVTFLTMGYWDDSNQSKEENNIMTLIADIGLEVAMYKADKGCLMHNENGNYFDPLEWWQNNHTKFPNAERVFSAAANIFDKRRARITADNAEILMFLRGNKSLVNWNA
jgi:hypothetical protein